MQKLQKIDWMLFSVAPRGQQIRRGVPGPRQVKIRTIIDEQETEEHSLFFYEFFPSKIFFTKNLNF